MFFDQPPILKHNFPVETLGGPPPPKGDPLFELKQLPDTLKYAYLDEKKIYHVIISANISEHEEKRLLKTLKKHRATIGYTLDDLKGISPTLGQHNINMEPDAKPVVDNCWLHMLRIFRAHLLHIISVYQVISCSIEPIICPYA